MTNQNKPVTPELLLYGVFHINVAFSCIPKSHYSLILDRCYWPLLELARRMRIPLAFEATGYSLEVLQGIDASYITALKQAWEKGEIEFVGASYTQSIFPLSPGEVNEQNLRLGMDVYAGLLGRKPETAYINEQTYSAGLVDLYLDAGYRQIFMEWNNPARFHAYPAETRYRPQRALNPDGTRSIALVWNDSIAFQKLQRYLNRSLETSEYLDFLSRHRQAGITRGLAFYGSDAEILDYHPGQLEAEYLESQGGPDVQRLVALLEQLQADPSVGWVTPSEFVKQFPPEQEHALRLESPEYPLPCKKQPKYNPTRWAVSGRDDAALNTRCYRQADTLLALSEMGRVVPDAAWRRLLETWGSDFRTYTTEEKLGLLRQTAASLEDDVQKALAAVQADDAGDASGMILWNPNPEAFIGPVVFEAQFPHGLLHGVPVLTAHPSIAGQQLEGIGHYQDGSVRWVKGVLMVNLPARQAVTFHWESVDIRPKVIAVSDTVIQKANGKTRIETPALDLTLLDTRGGAVGALRFKQLDDKPWVGTIPHGTFEDITLGADFYSGHFILASKAGEKATDLAAGQMQVPETLEDYPIRIPVRVGVRTEIGNLWKTIYVYRDLPRVDLLYHFRFQDVAASSCRVGIATLLPDAFDRETLAYRTVNGGKLPERFMLKDHHVTHDEPVSIRVSAQHGLGATQGWVALEDATRRFVLRTYPGQAYAMPMIHYEEADPGYFLRILPSIGEFDDTSHTLRRGHHQVMFTWEGQPAAEPVTALRLPLSLSAHVQVLPV